MGEYQVSVTGAESMTILRGVASSWDEAAATGVEVYNEQAPQPRSGDTRIEGTVTRIDGAKENGTSTWCFGGHRK